MAASNIPVSAEENLGDPIDIRVDIIHPEPVAAVAFPAAAIVRTQAQHGEAIRLTALRFRADIAEAENASLRARIKTTEAIKKITRKRERQARVKIEQQLAAVQESQRQDREDFRKLKELVTSHSFFKAHDKHDIEEGNELRQMKHREDNKDDEQHNKRVCKDDKFEAIKYSLGPNEEYIAIRRCEYNTWERNEDSMSQIYQENFQKKDNGWKDLTAKEIENVGEVSTI
ncbi:hypothetical protein Tco_0523013 [Tanacetum coccineum]